MLRYRLQERVTHRYRDGWAHEDQWRRLGDVKVLPARCVEEPRDYDDGGVYLARAIIPRGMDPHAAKRALADTFSGSSCQHEWDCCGCESRYTSVKRVGRREFVLRTRVTFNY